MTSWPEVVWVNTIYRHELCFEYCPVSVIHSAHTCKSLFDFYSLLHTIISITTIEGLGSPKLLCVSCPSATEFSAILFLLLARSSSNSPRAFQRFRRILRQNFYWIRQQMKNFPVDTIVKIARFRQRYKVAESGQFLQ